MPGYLLDTNIPVYLQTPDSPFHNPVKESFYKLQDDDQLFVSVLSLFELYYGAALKKKEAEEQVATQAILAIEEIKQRFTLLPLNVKEAPIFGEIKASYKTKFKEKEEKKGYDKKT